METFPHIFLQLKMLITLNGKFMNENCSAKHVKKLKGKLKIQEKRDFSITLLIARTDN